MLTFLLSYSLVFSTFAFADCKKEVQAIKKGQEAPCSGFLFSRKKEEEVRKGHAQNKITLEDLRIQTDMVSLYKKSLNETDKVIELERQKSELWRNRAEQSTHKLIESENGRARRDWMFFALGILATVGAGYAVGQVTK